MSADAPACFTVDGVTLTPHVEGEARMRALLELIDSAKKTLRLFYYMFVEDSAGERVRAALIEACRRGVSVSLTIDGFGSSASDGFLAPLEQAGADICRFQPRFGRRYLLRNHQKMAVADERRALVGGFNIAADYFDDTGTDRWRDIGLMVEGDSVRHLAGYYDALARWSRHPRPSIRDLRRALAHWSEPTGAVRWLMGGPSRRLNPWVRAVKRDIRDAMRLDMISAYFIPNPAMVRRIEAVARRGVVRLMTAARSDNELTIAAGRHRYHRLLRNGVRIWEYRASRLHSKLLIIDDVVYIGSANFDMRSLFLNLELMLRVKDRAFADHMRDYTRGERGRAQAITLPLHRRRRTWFARLRWAIAYFVVGVLDTSVTRRLNFGSRWRWR